MEAVKGAEIEFLSEVDMSIDCRKCIVMDCQFNSLIPKKSCSMFKPYMTPKNALHCMKFNCELAVCEECDVYGTVGTDHCFEDACREAIKALEKQIPKKPKIVETDMDGMDMETGEEYTYKVGEAHCINCDSVIGNEYIIFDEHYCRICGQKIDWLCWE